MSSLPFVHNREELETALQTGGNFFVDESSEILISGTQININSGKPTRLIGGRFRNDGTTHCFYVTQSNVTFDGCKFYGPGTTNGTFTSKRRFIYASGTNLDNMLTSVNVLNCTMYGSVETNIFFRYVSRSSIKTNYISDYLYGAILLLSCAEMTIDTNNIHDAVMRAPVVNTYAIAITDGANTIEARSRDIVVSNNIISNQPWEGIDTHGGKKITITGNILNNCVRGIALVSGNETRTTVPNDCVVTGNYIDGMGSTREGISLFGLSGNPADATITGNTVKGYKNNIYLSYYNRATTKVSGNSVPQVGWTPLTLAAGWSPNGNYPPEYMVDDDTVYFRGFAIPAPDAGPQIGVLPSAYTPSRYTFMSTSKAATSASTGVGTIAIHPTGAVYMLYRTTKDSYSYAIDGSFKMI